jgi:hypothetical protein
VVIVSHSQGGIIVSMVLDLLFADMPVENIAKLEIYTFGCAASHFNNPLRAIDPRSPTAKARVIRHIEHYANSDDLVTRWGVLYNICASPNNTFMGKVFVRRNASGHLLNQHYLSNMFPLPGENIDGPSFLDQVVDVHEVVDERRKHFAKSKCGLLDQMSSSEDPGREPVDGKDRKLAETLEPEHLERESGMAALCFFDGGAQWTSGDSVDDSPIEANGGHEASGGTVRELSRLWRYMGGLDPDRLDGLVNNHGCNGEMLMN